MFYRPIDPASLSGEALDQWYRRSPDQIEKDRQAAQQARYDDFFGSNGSTNVSGNDLGPGTPEPTRGIASGAARGSPYMQLASSSPASLDTVAGHVINCPTCHGRIPAPPLSALPGPWPAISAFENGFGWEGFGSGGSPRKTPKQCVIQERNDEEFCRGPSIPIPRHECWSRTAQRWGHCDRTEGVVGEPLLVRPHEWRAGQSY